MTSGPFPPRDFSSFARPRLSQARRRPAVHGGAHGLQIRARSRYSGAIRVVLAGGKQCQHPVRSQALRTLPLSLTAPFQASLAHRGARRRLPYEQIPRRDLDIPWRARRGGERRRVGLCELRALGCA